MHYELYLLCISYKYPYDSQSSRLNFNAAVTSYIWVTQILKLRMDTASLMKDIPVAIFFVTPSFYFEVTPLYIDTIPTGNG